MDPGNTVEEEGLRLSMQGAETRLDVMKAKNEKVRLIASNADRAEVEAADDQIAVTEEGYALANAEYESFNEAHPKN